uniref:YccV-like domain-containing protein n=1 Tax=Haemonchus contortus TaxID=6289 RepID=A0A7I5E5Y8_HAECO
MEVHPGVIFLTLVVVVPLQYYLSPSSSSDMKYYIQRLTDSVIHFTESFGVRLPFVSLRSDVKRVLNTARDNHDDGVTERDRADSASYGSSLRVRERAPHVQWRVGQVIKHKVHGYRAVIIGWDLKAQASKDFIERVHKGNEAWTNNPNYAVLIDTRDRLVPQLGYIVQENIELHQGRIIHNLLKNYMEKYDETKQKYIPKPWLRAIYPDD